MRKILFLLLFSVSLFASDPAKNAEIYGFLTLVPPVVAIVLAFITKDVILSLFIGVFSGSYMLTLINDGVIKAFATGFVDVTRKIINSMADPWNAGIMLQVLTIGGVIALITKMGGTRALAIWLSKKAKSALSTQVATWMMGLFIFFDDYASSLIVGPVMRPVTDKYKISREKLAFIIDATAAPIAGIAIISTWIGYELSVIKSAYEIIGITNINAFAIFIETIPYRFYNIFMLVFVIATAIMAREFGPMYKAEIRARQQGIVKSKNDISLSDENALLMPDDDIKLQASNAVVPVLCLIIMSVVGFYLNGLGALEGDTLARVKENPISFFALRETFGVADASVVIFQAALFATIVAIIMGVKRKIFNTKDAIQIWLEGWRTMLITIVILLLAWSLSGVIKELGTSTYLVELLSDEVPSYILPTVVFVLASFISFSTGTSYGTMGILMPLVVPLAFAIGGLNDMQDAQLHQYMITAIGSVLTGAIFGDHCSPISDTTILSSMGAGCEHLDHVSTQMPYSFAVGAMTILIGYLPVSLGLNVWICLLLGCVSMFLMLKLFGKKVE